jgi:preprotein translocase subunit Sss1
MNSFLLAVMMIGFVGFLAYLAYDTWLDAKNKAG